MADKIIKVRMSQKHDTDVKWEAVGVKDAFIPKDGEFIVYDYADKSRKFKIGNGTDAIGILPFQNTEGEKGDAATIKVGTVTTGAAGTDAIITNSGTTSDAVFDFVIPRGADGTPGTDGKPGADGAPGVAAGFGTPTATVDEGVGTPGVTVTATGPDTAKVFDFRFVNLKGEPGKDADVSKFAVLDGVNTFSGKNSFKDGVTAYTDGDNSNTIYGNNKVVFTNTSATAFTYNIPDISVTGKTEATFLTDLSEIPLNKIVDAEEGYSMFFDGGSSTEQI